MTTSNSRQAAYPIAPLFLDRWSPRAFTDATITKADLETMFEAARWAPSSFNAQPWRFIYALRGGPGWDAILGALMPFNQTWAEKAAALVIVASNTMMTMPGKEPSPSHSHSFDAGAAWASLAFQATMMGYATHGMAGVDFKKAAETLGVPSDYRLEAAIAIGRHGDIDRLPEKLREREVPSGRLSVAEIAFEAKFGG